MKTTLFNPNDAKAGRPTIMASGTPVRVIATENDSAWVAYDDGKYRTIHFSNLYHPADPAPGHNPDGLDEWTVGVRGGARCLTFEELRKRDLTTDIQVWLSKDKTWSGGLVGGNDPRVTYRTFKPPGYFLPPKPVVRNLRPEELPAQFIAQEAEGPPVIPIRWVTQNWDEDKIRKAANNGWTWSRSLNGPWRPFTITEL